jgi:hypothetical protein
MTDNDKVFDDLERLFAKGRRESEQMSAGLSQRILADADRVQAGFASASAPQAVARPGVWSQALSALGGWPALGGLVTAGAAGIWIGLAPPSFLPDLDVFIAQDSQDIDLIDMDGLVLALSEDG